MIGFHLTVFQFNQVTAFITLPPPREGLFFWPIFLIAFGSGKVESGKGGTFPEIGLVTIAIAKLAK
jgi:hypothetical protein